jgi:DNA topoisomerase-1
MKKYSTSTTLVIVESPAKCKKIEGYLGPGYKCMATFGHLRELTNLANVDMSNNFTAKYTVVDNAIKQKQIALLKGEIALAGTVLLATDDDREGEAIAWHVCQMFDLNPERTKRIIFHEVTEKALQEAVRNPRLLDMNIVKAQQTRQILDLLVGFKISPLLWKYITRNAEKSLSAGRCQTPALRLIYDNHREIEASPGRKVYNTAGYFSLLANGSTMVIPFDLNKQYEDEDIMVEFLDESVTFNYVLSCTDPIKVYKQPPKPLTTSRIQQAASNEMHISPKETMKICQTLYEAGYITYMRTDSEKYSDEFKGSAQEYILKTYDERYVNQDFLSSVNETKREEVKVKGKGKAKEKTKETDKPDKVDKDAAHEAIRPTNISLKELPDKMEPKEKRMYKLIWQTTLESCMSAASFFSIKATISAPMSAFYTCTSELLDFPGWMAVKKSSASLVDANSQKMYSLFKAVQGTITVKCTKVLSTVGLKDTKQHYTEARLVHLLEEKGIGRPSTFSSLVDKIQERGYVKRQDIPGRTVECRDFEMSEGDVFETESQREFGAEKHKLVIQPLGILVLEFLEKHFAELFNYDYTRQMEDALDAISKNSHKDTDQIKDLCKECLDQIQRLVGVLENDTNSGKVAFKIDDLHTYVIGKHGPVIKCSGPGPVSFKPVKPNIDLRKLELGQYKLEDVVAEERDSGENVALGKYEGEDLFVKSGKFGIYAAWGKETRSLKCFGNRPIENITFQEVLEVLEKEGNIVRAISDTISIRKSNKGNYIFFKTPKMKKPSFFSLKECELDYMTTEVSLVAKWINDRFKIN